jgi:hypothetical protein
MTVLDGPPAPAARISRLNLITGTIVLLAATVGTAIAVRVFFY